MIRDVCELVRTVQELAGKALRGLQSEDRADLAQQVTLKLWERHGVRKDGALEFELATPINAGYVWVALVLAAQGLRKKSAERSAKLKQVDILDVTELAAADIEPIDELINSEEWADLGEHLLRGLSPREREVLRLSYVQGKNPSEIADAKGISRNAVDSILSRARRKIRESFLGPEPEGLV